MSFVVVLTADPALLHASALDHTTVAGVRAALRARAEPRWLAPAIASEIAIDAALPDALAAARAVLGHRPIDLNVVPAANRRKRLLVADMESTLIENEMLDDLAERVGIGPRVAQITRRAMNGELDFAQALRARVALLAGLPAARLDEAAEGIRVVPGAATLARTMRAHGAFTAIVSGGFRFFTARVRKQLGFDWDQANDLAIADGALTGQAVEPILDRDAKVGALRALAAERGLPLELTLAVGDGANDLPMIETAGFGVAFRPKPILAAAARLRIEHGDLTALLYLQGYAAAEFAR